MKLTQTQQVENYLNKVGIADNKTIASELNIITHNVRRITGQETLKGNFERVAKGVYVLSEIKLKEYQAMDDWDRFTENLYGIAAKHSKEEEK